MAVLSFLKKGAAPRRIADILAPLKGIKDELEARLQFNSADIQQAQESIKTLTAENASIGEALKTDLFKAIK